MGDTARIRASEAQSPHAISEIDVLWITAGLGCDGDTIAMTAATQPSIEDIVLGSMPWIPKVHFHNPFLAVENGDEFLSHFHLDAKGKLLPPWLGTLLPKTMPPGSPAAELQSNKSALERCAT